MYKILRCLSIKLIKSLKREFRLALQTIALHPQDKEIKTKQHQGGKTTLDLTTGSTNHRKQAY